MARGSNASQGRTARSSVNGLPAPPEPNKNYKSKGTDFDFDYKAALEKAKTTESDWERNIEYQKDGSWKGKLTATLKAEMKNIFADSDKGRVARSETGGSKQDNYWASLNKKGEDATKAKESNNSGPGDTFMVGHRIEEVSGKDIVEKKKIILAEAQKELKAGNLTGDLPEAGVVKLSGRTERFAGGASLQITAIVSKDSPLGKAFNAHRERMDKFDYKDRSESTRNAINNANDAFRNTYGKQLRKLETRLASVVGQFQYTRMNYLDDGFGTNFYGGAGLVVEGNKGEKLDAKYYT
jgi:hypothetical protein